MIVAITPTSAGEILLSFFAEGVHCLRHPPCWRGGIHRGGAMAIAVSLLNWTDQGIRNIKDAPQRRKAFSELCQKHDVKIREQLITIGPYNMLFVLEGSEESLGAVMITLQKRGNVRSMSMRAMTPETFTKILEKVE
jgi:uncharacterized protein with GYD domain